MATAYSHRALKRSCVKCKQVKHSLTWSTPPELMPTFDPLLVNCAEGLREAQYPLHFVACQSFKEMVQSQGAHEKVIPLLPRIVPGIRKALLAGSAAGGQKVMQGALEAVRDLAWAVGPDLTPHMNPILIQVSKKMFDRHLKADVVQTLQVLEEAGGEGMLALIRTKVPAYAPLCILQPAEVIYKGIVHCAIDTYIQQTPLIKISAIVSLMYTAYCYTHSWAMWRD
eukprot:scaffold450056_cov40-Prasinocladus_malaysianus.AAC.1